MADLVRLGQLATPLLPVFGAYLAEHDRFVDRADLRTILRFMNHPEVLAASHSAYLVGGFHAADGDEYPGPTGSRRSGSTATCASSRTSTA